jgi:hypothetical protein
MVYRLVGGGSKCRNIQLGWNQMFVTAKRRCVLELRTCLRGCLDLDRGVFAQTQVTVAGSWSGELTTGEGRKVLDSQQRSMKTSEEVKESRSRSRSRRREGPCCSGQGGSGSGSVAWLHRSRFGVKSESKSIEHIRSWCRLLP